ncbi:glutathione S-transferase [Apiospora rasikravindrae]|uniref:Glutathione S-transferase n=1 Tax=Apiospora rasikravindrae TaxID=990691 RepID=A0ABR1U7Q7_9PEZI
MTSIPTEKAPKLGLNIYGFDSPNPAKCRIMAEELGIPYNYVNLDLSINEVKADWYVGSVNPNGKVPAIVHVKEDGTSVTVWESAACLLYMAHEFDKDHKFSYPIGTPEYWSQMSWLSWQISGYGAMMGQAAHFNRYAPSPQEGKYGSWRYTAECRRLHDVLDKQLSTSRFVAGDRMTVADFAIFIFAHSAKWCGIDINEFPHVKAWHDRLAQRSAIQKALQVPGPYPFSDEAVSKPDGKELKFLKEIRELGTQGIKTAHDAWEKEVVPVPSDGAKYAEASPVSDKPQL